MGSSNDICLPAVSASPVLSKCAPAFASRTVSHSQPKPLGKLEGENRPPAGKAPIRYKPSIVNVKKVANVKACRTIETCSRVSPNGPIPCKVLFAREEKQLERAAEDAGCFKEHPEDARKHSLSHSKLSQWPALSQVPALSRPSEMEKKQQAYGAVVIKVGEGRWNCAIVNKIDNTLLTPCSPEAPAGLTLPIPPSPTAPLSFRHDFAKTPTAKQCDDIVISKEEASASEHIREAGAAFTIPACSTTLPVQIDAPRQSTDKCSPEIMPRRPGLRVTDTRHATSASTCSPTNGKPSKDARAPSREGSCLERAAEYIRECMSRHAPICDAFVLQAQRNHPTYQRI